MCPTRKRKCPNAINLQRFYFCCDSELRELQDAPNYTAKLINIKKTAEEEVTFHIGSNDVIIDNFTLGNHLHRNNTGTEKD
jgi:hypothetical protein